jgi:integrase/recombinase XerD
MLQVFLAHAGPERRLDDIVRADCETFLATFQDRGCKPNTLKAYHRVLDALFNRLVAEEQLTTSPMKRVPKPRVPDELIKPLTPEELKRLLEQPDRTTFTGLRDAAFIALLADSGLRVSEALSLTLGDSDTRHRSLSLVGKGAKARTVFYGNTAARHLAAYLKRRPEGQPDEPLFLSSLGEGLDRFNMSARIHRYGQAAGIKGKRVSPHTLRHTFAISWLLGGGDALSLQRLLGHASPEMTARYVNFAAKDLSDLHRAVSPLDRLGSKPCQTGSPVRKRLR